jgi:hypothetical protein
MWLEVVVGLIFSDKFKDAWLARTVARLALEVVLKILTCS